MIVSDTFGRPWREGQTDVAIGIAGLVPLQSYIGQVDPHGHEFRVQELCVVDELAAAAELVKGNTSRVPVAIVRGYPWVPDEAASMAPVAAGGEQGPVPLTSAGPEYRYSGRICGRWIGELVVVALAGFFASMVDGALGMGFGPTSSSILLSTGISPASASASVNLAKVVTGIVAGLSHWKLRNIDKRLVVQLAVPGAVGALVGTTVLANVDGDALRPYLAVLLLLVGLRILVRFSQPIVRPPGRRRDVSSTASRRRARRPPAPSAASPTG